MGLAGSRCLAPSQEPVFPGIVSSGPQEGTVAVALSSSQSGTQKDFGWEVGPAGVGSPSSLQGC